LLCRIVSPAREEWRKRKFEIGVSKEEEKIKKAKEEVNNNSHSGRLRRKKLTSSSVVPVETEGCVKIKVGSWNMRGFGMRSVTLERWAEELDIIAVQKTRRKMSCPPARLMGIPVFEDYEVKKEKGRRGIMISASKECISVHEAYRDVSMLVIWLQNEECKLLAASIYIQYTQDATERRYIIMGVLRKLEEVAGGYPVIAIGDWNSSVDELRSCCLDF